MAMKKAAGGKMAATRKKSPAKMPGRIFAQASPLSIGGLSMFEASTNRLMKHAEDFNSETRLVKRAVALLKKAGFDVLAVSPSSINIAGSQATFEQAFGARLALEQREVIKPFVGADLAEFVECPSTEMLGLIDTKAGAFSGLLEGVALEEPRYYFAESVYPPLKAYWHLDVPAGVSLGCNADKAHRAGVTGKDVKVSMVDSGWYRHRFFDARGYRANAVLLGPGAANPAADESGHGTGESANIFAVAPDVTLLPVKMHFANSKSAFDAAVALKPDIITCSWGSDIRTSTLSAANTALAISIANAVASGIIVVFSAGNGHWGFPGQHPDVISAGGVFMDVNEKLRASDYASGFNSPVYSGRKCPDLSGLVGMLPRAAYIMLPVQPGDELDTGSSGGTHPNGDETTARDGWGAFSGTSAAAPQLAGACALIKQACGSLKPADVKKILMNTARDVTTGNCNPSAGGNAAGPGYDIATGSGLVDAWTAVQAAQRRCRQMAAPATGRPMAARKRTAKKKEP